MCVKKAWRKDSSVLRLLLRLGLEYRVLSLSLTKKRLSSPHKKDRDEKRLNGWNRSQMVTGVGKTEFRKKEKNRKKQQLLIEPRMKEPAMPFFHIHSWKHVLLKLLRDFQPRDPDLYYRTTFFKSFGNEILSAMSTARHFRESYVWELLPLVLLLLLLLSLYTGPSKVSNLMFYSH